MRPISNSCDLRKIQMDILTYVDAICSKNNIKYSISGGTLIGAVRHKGFIPWDDDIDIMLTRPEYNRLIKALTETYTTNQKYRILTHSIDKDFKFPYAKIVDEDTILVENTRDSKNYGVFIDVFPIDNVSTDGYKATVAKMRKLYNILTLKKLVVERERSLWKNLTIIGSRLLLAPVSADWIIERMEKFAVQLNNEKTDLMGCLVWGYGEKEIVPSSVHDNHIYLPFEDRKYMAVKDYDVYLSHLYGDYMKLPPKEKQISHHDFEAYWKD